MAQSVIKQIGVGGVIGIVVGIVCALIGLVIAFAVHIVIGILYTVLFIVVGSIFWFSMFRPMVERNRLLEIGESADAAILVVKENGSSLTMGGAVPKAGVDILLDVRPKDKAPYHASVNMFVSMFEISKYQSGSIVRVKFDPKNPQKVAIIDVTSPLGGFSSK